MFKIKGMVKGWVVCPHVTKTLVSSSVMATPFKVLIYHDINKPVDDFVN